MNLPQRLPAGRACVCRRSGARVTNRPAGRLAASKLDGRRTRSTPTPSSLACPAFVGSTAVARYRSEPDLPARTRVLVEYVSCVNRQLALRRFGRRRGPAGVRFLRRAHRRVPPARLQLHQLEIRWSRAPRGCVMLRAFLGGAGRETLDGIDDGQSWSASRTRPWRALLDLRGAPRFGHARQMSLDAMPHPVIGISDAARTARRKVCPTSRSAVALADLIGLPDCIESAEKAAQRLTGRRSGAPRVVEQAG